ncbi:hypothetical protein GEMRC1_014125 [Eukaryota sp. GEM-RC1]
MYGQNSDLTYTSGPEVLVIWFLNVESTRRSSWFIFILCGFAVNFSYVSNEVFSLNLCAYADDASLVGSIDDLLSAFSVLIEHSNEIGLQLNSEKCFLIGSSLFE